jgi:hypothetical protein
MKVLVLHFRELLPEVHRFGDTDGHPVAWGIAGRGGEPQTSKVSAADKKMGQDSLSNPIDIPSTVRFFSGGSRQSFLSPAFTLPS